MEHILTTLILSHIMYDTLRINVMLSLYYCEYINCHSTAELTLDCCSNYWRCHIGVRSGILPPMSLSDLQDSWRPSTIVYAHNLPHNNAGTRHCVTVKLQIILTVLAILFGFIVQLLLKEICTGHGKDLVN